MLVTVCLSVLLKNTYYKNKCMMILVLAPIKDNYLKKLSNHYVRSQTISKSVMELLVNLFAFAGVVSPGVSSKICMGKNDV